MRSKLTSDFFNRIGQKQTLQQPMEEIHPRDECPMSGMPKQIRRNCDQQGATATFVKRAQGLTLHGRERRRLQPLGRSRNVDTRLAKVERATPS